MIQKKHQLFHVHRIHDASSVWLSEPFAIVDSVVAFFQDLLTDGDGQFQLYDFSFILSLIIDEEDVDLCRIPDMREIRQMVFSIDPDNAPRLDGFYSRFYQSFWGWPACCCFGFLSPFFFCLAYSEKTDFFYDYAVHSNMKFLVDLLCLEDSRVRCWFFYPRRIPQLLGQIFDLWIFVMLVIRCWLSCWSCVSCIISPSQSSFVSSRVLHDNVLLVQEIAHVW